MTLILNLVIIGPKFQCAVDEKVVVFVVIFPTALSSIWISGLGDIIKTVLPFHLESLRAEIVYIVST